MRIAILFYGLTSYFIGVTGLVSIIGAIAGFIPFGFLGHQTATGISPWLWNLALVAIWGFIHSFTARPGFKKVLTRIIPEAAERSTYILISGVTSIALIGLWQVIPGHVWSLEMTAIVYTLWGLFIFGWVFLLASTFAINHLDLFGLRQVYLNFRNQERPPLQFTERLMYRYVRHPIQTGVLIGIWATPSMSMTQIALSLGFTAYIVVGVWFEERDLVAEHGDAYRSYRQRTGSVIPKIGSAEQ
ncbi:MAG: isoprenylcysteine carboxylmethyltransferase family protein [Gammaproteobacteria bacterium]|nr:isoprenylcysteine carboxylmethyltransferase family protein [Gammaproteobacteria bacterium]